MPQNQNWRIRLAAVKVKKTALTGIVDDVSLKQATAGQTVQSGRRFVYDEAGHLVGEYDSTGKTIQELVWLEDLPVASIRPKATGGTETFFIHPDHLGTPRQVTDSANRIVWRWDTVEAFGQELPSEDPDRDGVRFEFNLRFPGQYYDRETGRHYNGFRDYDPATGRYPTTDPIGTVRYKDMAIQKLAVTGPISAVLAASLYSPYPEYNHPYAYGFGNPLTYTDSEGLSSSTPGFGMTGPGSGSGMSCGPDKNCEVLRDNILKQTCASIRNPRARAACVAAAWLTYWSCLAQK